jgi:hypothetical protein
VSDGERADEIATLRGNRLLNERGRGRGRERKKRRDARHALFSFFFLFSLFSRNTERMPTHSACNAMHCPLLYVKQNAAKKKTSGRIKEQPFSFS